MRARLGNGSAEGKGKNGLKTGANDISRNLHTRSCSVCGHPQREDIERDILAWRSPKAIVKEYKLGNRKAVYRHAHAFGLMERRYVDLRAALGRIIEKAEEAPVTAWSVVAAVRACAKINARGQWMERGESNEMRELLDGMNHEELLAYAEHGTLTAWFRGTGAAAVSAQEAADA